MTVNKNFLILCLLFSFSSNALVSFKSAADVLANNIEFVECAFADIHGNLKTVTIPAYQLEAAFTDGLKFDSSSVPGCASINNSDMHLKLDLSACIILPPALRNYKTIMVMCDIGLSQDEDFKGCTRTLLKKQQQKLSSLNLQLNMGAELEFYVLDSDQNGIDNDKYFDSSANINYENCKLLLLDTLLKAGLPVEKIHHEVGPGQYEITFRYGDCLTTADTVLFAKYIIKSIVNFCGATATFMPKPFIDQNGSGMHVHYSLFNTNQQTNIFYCPDGTTNLSLTAQSFLAGNLKYMLEISALLNPSINSYKRLVAGYEAPVYICWGIKNRSALIRIPLINPAQTNAIRAELRCPDAGCNPYLAFAAIACSGQRGINDQLSLANPITGNLYKLNSDQIKKMGIMSLHDSLDKAITYLNNSSFVEDFLGKHLLNSFVHIKTKEIKSFDNRHGCANEDIISKWELDRYL
jgi:glutamine synthetase